MNRWISVLLLCCIQLLAGGFVMSDWANAAYYVNGSQSTVGVYGYGNEYLSSAGLPESGSDPDGGDAGVQYRTFANGALMDSANPNDAGAQILFRNAPRTETVFMDLGQAMNLDSLAVRSNLYEWWALPDFTVSFSTDGVSFTNTILTSGGGMNVPHARIQVNRNPSVSGITARFIRFRFSIEPWDLAQIGEVEIHASCATPLQSMTNATLVALVEENTLTPAIDEFGQWTRDDWPGKAHSVAELVSHHETDEALYANVELNNRVFDKYGGNKTLGIYVTPDGKWHLQKIDNKWWFITPAGYPFLIIGMDSMECWVSYPVESPSASWLEGAYEWLPSKSGDFQDCWNGSDPANGIYRYQFLWSNLRREFDTYYPNWIWDRWAETAQRRLVDWGFNTCGKWSEVVHNKSFESIGRPIPYIVHLGEFHDPWDTGYQASVNSAVQSVYTQNTGCPYLIGGMFYGEYWWNISTTSDMLASTSPSNSKVAFVDQLQQTYTLAQLNTKCGANWTSFEDLYDVDMNAYSVVLASDISNFVVASSQRFHGFWRRAVDAYYPGLLILGACVDPTGNWQVCPEWIQGSTTSCDALCCDWYNTNAADMLQYYVEKYAVPADKPVIIGEVGFSTPHYGYQFFNNACTTQAERGQMYQSVYESLYAHPNWVGVNYYQYANFPLLGVGSDGIGESSQWGFVDNCDMPYYDFVNSAKATNQGLYNVHANHAIAQYSSDFAGVLPYSVLVDNFNASQDTDDINLEHATRQIAGAGCYAYDEYSAFKPGGTYYWVTQLALRSTGNRFLNLRSSSHTYYSGNAEYTWSGVNHNFNESTNTDIDFDFAIALPGSDASTADQWISITFGCDTTGTAHVPGTGWWSTAASDGEGLLISPTSWAMYEDANYQNPVGSGSLSGIGGSWHHARIRIESASWGSPATVTLFIDDIQKMSYTRQSGFGNNYITLGAHGTTSSSAADFVENGFDNLTISGTSSGGNNGWHYGYWDEPVNANNTISNYCASYMTDSTLWHNNVWYAYGEPPSWLQAPWHTSAAYSSFVDWWRGDGQRYDMPGIVRWVSDRTGTVRILGSFQRNCNVWNAYDGTTTLGIAKNANNGTGILWSQTFAKGDCDGSYDYTVHSFDVTVSVNKEDKIDFIIDPNHDYRCDDFLFSASIAGVSKGSVSINAGAHYCNSTSVTLVLRAVAPGNTVSQMRFSNDGTSWSGWETYAASKSWTLVSGSDGSRTVYVQYKDAAGNTTDSITDTITLDTTLPTGSLSIDSGAAYCASTSATIAISATDADSGVSLMRLSNDNSTWSPWLGYGAADKAWVLSSGEGEKTVYVQYKDRAENVPSGNITDTIIFDTTAPTAGACTPPAHGNATISVPYSGALDASSGLNRVELWYKYQSSGTWANSGLIKTAGSDTFAFTTSNGIGQYYFDLVAEDNAGYRSAAASGDGDGSTISEITVPTAGACTPPAYANTATIFVPYSGASDSDSGLNKVELWYKHQSGGAWTNSGLTKTAGSDTFVFTPPSGGGEYYFDLVAEDNSGNRSAAASGDGDGSTVYDITAPTAGTCSPPPYANTAAISVSYSGASDYGSGLKEVELWYKYQSGGAWTNSGLTKTAGSDMFAFIPPSGGGEYYFDLVAEDNAGNRSAAASGTGDGMTAFGCVFLDDFDASQDTDDINLEYTTRQTGAAGSHVYDEYSGFKPGGSYNWITRLTQRSSGNRFLNLRSSSNSYYWNNANYVWAGIDHNFVETTSTDIEFDFAIALPGSDASTADQWISITFGCNAIGTAHVPGTGWWNTTASNGEGLMITPTAWAMYENANYQDPVGSGSLSNIGGSWHHARIRIVSASWGSPATVTLFIDDSQKMSYTRQSGFDNNYITLGAYGTTTSSAPDFVENGFENLTVWRNN